MKKKILLLSDDLRIPSGVGTMSKALVMGTCHKYDWVQIGGAVKHPEAGKIFDLSEDVKRQTNVNDAFVKVYPVSGYGNENVLREVMNIEKPDAICHFTDPRFWGWLYQMEHELRYTTPLMYLNIWDDLPFPHWNEDFYESCDLLMAISKQTYNINKHVCQRKPRVEGKDLFYVPHGIDQSMFFPINNDPKYNEFRHKLLGEKDYDFIALFNSRNIHRKRPADLMLAFTKFCDSLPAEKSSKCAILLHTDVVDQHGTDLEAVAKELCTNYSVIFSNAKVTPEQLNFLYNIADVTCNPSSAEGFGLSHMESLMAGTPTIATVVGGLQDQLGFKVADENGDRELNVSDFTAEIPSNSTGEISKEYGEWTYALWPQLNLQGSPMTPYIYDSRPNILDIQKGLKFWYDLGRSERKRRGLTGRTWAIENGFTQEGMCNASIKAIDTCFETFEPRERYVFIDTDEPVPAHVRGELI